MTKLCPSFDITRQCVIRRRFISTLSFSKSCVLHERILLLLMSYRSLFLTINVSVLLFFETIQCLQMSGPQRPNQNKATYGIPPSTIQLSSATDVSPVQMPDAGSLRSSGTVSTHRGEQERVNTSMMNHQKRKVQMHSQLLVRWTPDKKSMTIPSFICNFLLFL